MRARSGRPARRSHAKPRSASLTSRSLSREASSRFSGLRSRCERCRRVHVGDARVEEHVHEASRAPRAPSRRPSRRCQLEELAAVDELHHDEVAVLVLRELVEADDVRVADLAHDADLRVQRRQVVVLHGALRSTFTANWSFVRRLIASLTSPNWPAPSTFVELEVFELGVRGSSRPAPSAPASSLHRTHVNCWFPMAVRSARASRSPRGRGLERARCAVKRPTTRLFFPSPRRAGLGEFRCWMRRLWGSIRATPHEKSSRDRASARLPTQLARHPSTHDLRALGWTSRTRLRRWTVRSPFVAAPSPRGSQDRRDAADAAPARARRTDPRRR